MYMHVAYSGLEIAKGNSITTSYNHINKVIPEGKGKPLTSYSRNQLTNKPTAHLYVQTLALTLSP